MMKQLPTTISTFLAVIKLYKKSILGIIPFSLILFACNITLLFIIKHHLTNINAESLAILALCVSIHHCIFLIALSATIILIYQKKHSRPYSYRKVLSVASTRIFQIFIAEFILFFPFLTIGALWFFFTPTAETIAEPHSLQEITNNIMLKMHNLEKITTILSFLKIGWLLIFLKSCLTPVIITLKNMKAIAGLKRSWELIRSHWWQTCLMLLILIFFEHLVIGLSEKLIGYSSIFHIIFSSSPLYISFMIIHYENLERIKRSSTH